MLYSDAADQLIAFELRLSVTSLGRGEFGDGLRALQWQHAVWCYVLTGLRLQEYAAHVLVSHK